MSHRNGPILILFLALAGNANMLSGQTQKVEVQIYDYADLKPGTLQGVVAHIQDILGEAGTSVQVRLCRGGLAVACESSTEGVRRLVIRVVDGQAKKMRNVRRPPLGQSFCDHEGGIYASIFLERVQDSAAETSVPWVVVLAYATVHEVGHLLLGADAHTPQGVMKATWDREDYQAMNQNHFHFVSAQVQELANRYGASPPEDRDVGVALASLP